MSPACTERLDAFSFDYAAARQKFRHAAARAGAELESYANPAHAPDGGALSTDVASLGAADADRVLLVNGGRLLFDGPVDDLAEEGSLEQPFYRLTGGGAVPGDGDEDLPDAGAPADEEAPG